MAHAFDPRSGPAWVTGASSGIGRALALRLAADGWTVAASARSVDELQDLAREAEGLSGAVEPYPVDTTDRAAVATVAAKIASDYGPIALAVLNAGTHAPFRAKDIDADIFRKLMDVNVMGTVHCLEPLIPDMMARGGGHIAVVASVAGYCGLPTAAAYGCTKAGLINMCEALIPELSQAGVKLQIVNPGFVKTPLTDKNDFPMPFLMPVDKAAEAFYRGLRSERTTIVFPWRLAFLLRLIRLLPDPLFYAVTKNFIPKDAG